MDVLELTFLGTASAYPTPSRCVSCTALQHDTGVWLFDCGEGSQIQLMKSQLKPGKVDKIFITHLHGDHVYGLPGLLCTISRNNLRTDPVEIYGPVGLRHYLCSILHHSRSDIGFTFCVIEMQTLPCQAPDDSQEWPVEEQTHIPFVPSETPGRTVTADENEIWHLYSDEKLSVSAVRLKHRIASFGFVIQEAEKPGKLNAAKLKSLGVAPGPQFAKIKSGEALQLENGQMVYPHEVLGEPTPGRLLIVGGDSSDSSQLLKIGTNATVMVHEATLENARQEICVQNGHSTPEMTATLAKQLNVGTLILTHVSQRYKPLGTVMQEGDLSAQILLDEARQVLPSEKVLLAEDLMVYKVKSNRRDQ